MKIESLDLPEEVKQFYLDSGILELYPPQSEAIEEVIIARLFPEAVIFLESALLHYGYTDRIPSAWQIAVDKNSKKTKYDIDYPLIEPYYLEPNFVEAGIDTIRVENVEVRIYDRDRTICDVLRYEKNLRKKYLLVQ